MNVTMKLEEFKNVNNKSAAKVQKEQQNKKRQKCFHSGLEPWFWLEQEL